MTAAANENILPFNTAVSYQPFRASHHHLHGVGEVPRPTLMMGQVPIAKKINRHGNRRSLTKAGSSVCVCVCCTRGFRLCLGSGRLFNKHFAVEFGRGCCAMKKSQRTNVLRHLCLSMLTMYPSHVQNLDPYQSMSYDRDSRKKATAIWDKFVCVWSKNNMPAGIKMEI